jgi:hypothetical protein
MSSCWRMVDAVPIPVMDWRDRRAWASGRQPGTKWTDIGKLSELGLSGRHTQILTYFGSEAWARIAREDEGIAHLGRD